MDSLLLKFLLPSADGSIHSLLQMTFAALFIGAAIAVPSAVSRAARREEWERNFAALDRSGAGTATLGSADELANAVATPAERWADVMPSLLLVFGLLGTFIGLGLALTEAAGALGPGADALANLTPIMDSLGSKFKTSTWGIFAFLVLKVWFTFKPYDKRRNDWAAAKLHAIAARSDAQKRRNHDDERRELIAALANHRDSMHEGQQRALQQASQRHGEQLAVLQELATWQKQIGKHGAETIDGLARIVEHSAASRIAMEEFSHSVRDNIQSMAAAAGDMALAAEAARNASTQLSGAVGEFENAMTTVLGEVKTELGATIGSMGTTFADNMGHMSSNLKAATDGIQAAIELLSGGVTETITHLQKASDDAAERQGKASATFAASGETLMANIALMGDFMKEIQEQVKVGLTSISMASNRMLSLDKQFAQRTAQDASTLEAVEGVAGSMTTLVAHLESVERNLSAAAPIADNIRTLAEVVARQQAIQAASDERQQKQVEENTRVVASIGSLASAIAELSLAGQQDATSAVATAAPETQ